MRPQIRLMVANPVQVNRVTASISRRHEGFILVNVRQVLTNLEVRASVTPSSNPDFFASLKGWRDDNRVLLTILPQAILGFHKLESGDLDHITKEGAPLVGAWTCGATTTP